MAFDLCMIKAYDILNIDSISSDYLAGTLTIKGKDVGRADKFIIDGKPITVFTRISDNEAVISYPFPAQSIIPIGQTVGIQTAGGVNYEWPGIKKISGAHRVAQRLLHFLMRTPGTDFFNPQYGAGFRYLLGASVDQDQVAASVRVAFDKAASNVRETQLASWPANERLASVNYSKVGYDAVTSKVTLELTLITEDGQSASFYLG